MDNVANALAVVGVYFALMAVLSVAAIIAERAPLASSNTSSMMA